MMCLPGLLLIACLIPGRLLHRVELGAGESVSVRCHYEPRCRRGPKVWCRQISDSECVIVAPADSKTARPDQQDKVQILDNTTYNFVTFTLRSLQQGDSGVYFCGVHSNNRVHALGMLEIQVSRELVTGHLDSTPRTTTAGTSPVSSLSVRLTALPEVPGVDALGSDPMSFFLVILFVIIMVTAVVIFIRVIVRFRRDHIKERSKLPLVMARLTRRRVQQNVYGAPPRRTPAAVCSAPPRSRPPDAGRRTDQGSHHGVPETPRHITTEAQRSPVRPPNHGPSVRL
nr:PREDICTED: trem-like transcript 4 protein isoform X1 [Lepisosteus oculatus]